MRQDPDNPPTDDIGVYLTKIEQDGTPPLDYRTNYLLKRTVPNTDIKTLHTTNFHNITSDDITNNWSKEDDSYKIVYQNSRVELIADPDIISGDGHPEGHYVERLFDTPKDASNWTLLRIGLRTDKGAGDVVLDYAVGL